LIYKLIIPSSANFSTYSFSGSCAIGNTSSQPIEGDQNITIVPSTPNNPPLNPYAPVGPSSGNVGQSLSFSVSSTDPDNDQIRYCWDWNGDNSIEECSNYGASGWTQTISHTFSAPGTYNIKVKASDSRSSSNWSQSLSINILSSGLYVNIGNSYSGTTGTSINFVPSVGGGTYPYTYSWSFGDGQTSNQQNPSHSYSSPGTYNVNLTVTDVNNIRASDVATATITGLITQSQTSSVKRILPYFALPGSTITIKLNISVGNSRYYGLNETMPLGWNVSSIVSPGAMCNSNIDCLVMNAVDTLITYNVRVPENIIGIYNFTGYYKMEGMNSSSPILGNTSIIDPMIPLITIRNPLIIELYITISLLV